MLNRSMFHQIRLTAIEQNLNILGITVETGEGDAVQFYWTPQIPINVYSCAKTITSLAVGVCMAEGKLRIDDRVLDYFPEYQNSAAPLTEKIRIRDLLHMASGKLLPHLPTHEEVGLLSDWLEIFMKTPVTKEPGTYFFYSSYCTYMLGRIIERVYKENLRDFLMPRFFLPLGIFNPQWHTCPKGYCVAAKDLYLSNEQLSRLGSVLLHKGVYKGTRIVSEDYINEAITDLVDNAHVSGGDPDNSSGYGYQLWRCAYPGAYRAYGIGGNFCIVIPDKDAVITVTADYKGNHNDVLRAVMNDLVPLL